MLTLKLIISSLLIVCLHASSVKLSRPKAITPQHIYFNPETHQVYRRYDGEAVESQSQPEVHTVQTEQSSYHPLTFTGPTTSQQDALNVELYPYVSLQLPTKSDSYDFYSSQTLNGPDSYDGQTLDEEEKYLQEFHPPAQSNEPNYYALKPRKTNPKKFLPNKKHVNLKEKSKITLTNSKYNNNNNKQEDLDFDDSPIANLNEQYFIAIDGTPQSSSPEKFEQIPLPSNQQEQQSKIDIAERKDRIDFQVHGFDGPKSYKFGYDTGKGKNRQFRFEERDRDGNVIGHYGYLDKAGKLNVVKYKSTSDTGFQSEKAQK